MAKIEVLEKKVQSAIPEMNRLNERLEEQRIYAAVAMENEHLLREELSKEHHDNRIL